MLKKLLFTFSTILLSSSLHAQLDVKFDLWGATNRKIELSAEAGHDKLGLEFSFGYTFRPWADGVSINGQDVSVPRSGILLGFRPNYYIKPKTTLNGFYLSPYTYFSRTRIKFEAPLNHTRATAGLILGRKGHVYDQFFYLVEAGAGYNFVYKYTNAGTGEREHMEESIPLFGSLTKINMPIRVSIIYRIGEQ